MFLASNILDCACLKGSLQGHCWTRLRAVRGQNPETGKYQLETTAVTQQKRICCQGQQDQRNMAEQHRMKACRILSDTPKCTSAAPPPSWPSVCCVSSGTVRARYCWEPRDVRGAKPVMKKCRRGKGTLGLLELARESWELDKGPHVRLQFPRLLRHA